MNLLLTRQWWPGLAGGEEAGGGTLTFQFNSQKVLANEPTGQQWYW